MTKLNVSDVERIRRLRPVLAEMFSQKAQVFEALFMQERPVARELLDKPDLFIKLGLVEEKAGFVKAEVRILEIKGRFIVTDKVFSYKGADQIFPLSPEDLYVIDTMKVRKGDVVLDLGTGSGVLAIFAAEKAKVVYALDINPRAIQFAKFNAILNGVEKKIEPRLGDLFEPVKGIRFDYIVTNPPFNPVPQELKGQYPIHSYGGPDGLEIIARILKQVKDFLTERGILQMVWFSLGDERGPVIVRHLKRAFSKEHFEVRLLGDMPLKDFAERFKESAGEKAVESWLKARKRAGENRIWFGLVFLELGQQRYSDWDTFL